MGNARNKINSAYVNGAFITGIGLGALTESVVLGLIGFLVMLAPSVPTSRETTGVICG
jgi:hypothetical protein